MKMFARKISTYNGSWHTIIFMGLFIFMVSANKSHIIKTSKQSWISTENLMTLLNVSFKQLSCCNVFVDGEPGLIDNFLNGFIESYPSEYTLNRLTYACTKYLMISTSEEKLITQIKSVPSTIASLDLVVVVFDDIEESTGLLDTLLFGNANANIASLNGLWTLSENFLWPRVFTKVPSLDEMAHERRIVNLQAQEIRAAAFYKPPFCYIQTTVNRTVNGIEKEYYVEKNKSELDGIDLKIFMLIAERLNFTWTIRSLPDTNRWYGVSNGTHWIGGMIEEILQDNLDFGFTSVWVSVDKYSFVNLTRAWAKIYVHFLVPRPKPYSSFWALTRPLTPEVWAVVITMLIIQSLYVYTSAWVNPRIPRRFRTFAITWTEMMGRLIGTSAPETMQGLQLQFQLWHFIGILLVTAYSSSLAADLTNSRFEKSINSPRDFIEANLTWGRTQAAFEYYSYAVDPNDPYSRQFKDLYEQHPDEDERNELMFQEKYAILGTTIFSIFFPEEPVKNEFLSRFRLMKYIPASFYVSFAVQSWLLEPVDKVMLRMRETGIVEYHVDNVLRTNTGSALREVLTESEGNQNGPVVLQLIPLGAAFVLFGVGVLISTVTLYFEFRSVAKQKTIYQVLLKIKRNRESWQANQQGRKCMPSIKVHHSYILNKRAVLR